MAILDKIGYSYNDLTIVPAKISYISSRSECNPFDDHNNLPLFTAPMSCVVNEHNVNSWIDNKIIPILPRTVDINTRLNFAQRGLWVAMSLNEFREFFVDGNIVKYTNLQKCPEVSQNDPEGKKNVYKICIDIANGHMHNLYDMIHLAKAKTREFCCELVVMTGNIANPETYSYLSDSGVDYIRLSIGSGNGCLTTSNVSVHYPIATLINDCHIRRCQSNYKYPKIIADGGIRNYSDIIKALALGADYVMVGSLFSGFLESAASLYTNEYNYNKVESFSKINMDELFFNKIEANCSDDIEIEKRNFLSVNSNHLFKQFYGMSTKKAQQEIAAATQSNCSRIKTSEGIEKMIPCKYTIKQWTENFIDYLKSAMSYCGAKSLEYFRYNTDLIVNSINEINAVNK